MSIQTWTDPTGATLRVVTNEGRSFLEVEEQDDHGVFELLDEPVELTTFFRSILDAVGCELESDGHMGWEVVKRSE